MFCPGLAPAGLAKPWPACGIRARCLALPCPLPTSTRPMPFLTYTTHQQAARSADKARPVGLAGRACLVVVMALLAINTATPAQAAVAAEPKAKPGKLAKTSQPASPPASLTAKLASPHQRLGSRAKGLALATVTSEAVRLPISETLNASQLDVATRVLTGQADCEFQQTVQVQPLPGRPGLFSVAHLGRRFVMLPRETQTGAVRLEDPAAGVVWLQIPAKSMLMNARIGQRMVDACLHAEQRLTALASADATQGLGLVVSAALEAGPAVAAAPVAEPATPVPAPAAEPPSDTPAQAVAATADAEIPEDAGH